MLPGPSLDRALTLAYRVFALCAAVAGTGFVIAFAFGTHPLGSAAGLCAAAAIALGVADFVVIGGLAIVRARRGRRERVTARPGFRVVPVTAPHPGQRPPQNDPHSRAAV